MLWILEITVADGTIRRIPFVCPPELPPLQGIEEAVALAEEKETDLNELLSPAVRGWLDPARGDEFP